MKSGGVLTFNGGVGVAVVLVVGQAKVLFLVCNWKGGLSGEIDLRNRYVEGRWTSVGDRGLCDEGRQVAVDGYWSRV